MTVHTEFPPRYEPLERLGKGGGGEVWAARDRVRGRTVALKLLRQGADEPEMLALVREATALSGVEGLGVPHVLDFGRLPKSDRAYMVRELVKGQSLSDLLEDEGSPQTTHAYLSAVVQAADLLTRLHRALLLHGDIKPANIIVEPDGRATLVDLGLAAYWQEGGAKPEGLTPRYAAPELFLGEPLTPRAEVFALGATAAEVLRLSGATLESKLFGAVEDVVSRATAELPPERYPSADEFAEALRRAAGLEATAQFEGVAWSIVGLDAVCSELLDRIRDLPSGGGLVVCGPEGAGRSTLLHRVSWSLGVAGEAVGVIEGPSPPREPAGEGASDAPETVADSAGRTRLSGVASTTHSSPVDAALSYALTGRKPAEVILVVDDADQLSPGELARLGDLRDQGSRLVMVAAGQDAAFPGPTFSLFELPPLEHETAAALVRRMIPSLSANLVDHLVERTAGRPGALRTAVGRLEGKAVVSVRDVDRSLTADDPEGRPPSADQAEIHRRLDRGRFDEAAELLESHRDDRSLSLALARAKLATGRGDPHQAVRELEQAERELSKEENTELVAVWHLQMARALLRAGGYEQSETHANLALTRLGASLLTEMTAGPPPTAPGLGADAAGEAAYLAVDALAVCGLAQSFAARHEEAVRTLERSVNVARSTGNERGLAIALASLAVALQRDDKLLEAQQAHEEALGLAEKTGDAGSVATTRLNLAGLAKTRGDIAGALAHLEGAVDMGRRSGRHATVRHALLNLANLDLYLGRLARARASIETLAAERDSLSQVAQAQLLALEAESAAQGGDAATAEAKCRSCAEAYEELGRSTDAAEAILERVVVLAREADASPTELQDELTDAEQRLGDSGAHRSLLAIARANVAKLAGQGELALAAFEDAVESGRESGQREWAWRAHEGCAQLLRDAGQDEKAEGERHAALALLEEIAAELPADLREVYWNDPRRRAVREAPSRRVIRSNLPPSPEYLTTGPTQLGNVVREDRLARVLEINREIAGEHNLDKLLERVTDAAIALLSAERGFVLLRSRADEDELSIHAARDRTGDDPYARFSRSIAERVVRSGEPFVTVDVDGDDRVADYVSVHQLMLKSVASVPIRARNTQVIGALYLETRNRSAALFHEELPTLKALADQVAIAIETARLVSENLERAAELEQANTELAAANTELVAARAKLEELLGRRTEQLASTRRNLRTARAAIHSHFGYKNIVGSSAPMRRVYAIIDRVKDADVPVLITGESGTGKEVVARAIHQAGPRSKARFVGVNCGAIPEHLLESELFGHMRGAFTGAERDKKGLFRELSDGTILLDEIGEMPPKMQSGLLRVLQEKVVRPVGGTHEEAVNTRVIAATHRDLGEMVADGSFREDLYYRLNVIHVRVPPLRERLDDIPMLIDHFLRRFAVRYHRDRRTVSREALKRLTAFAWPGNVRQLDNVLLNAWILSDSAELEPDDFELPEQALGASSLAHSAPPPPTLDAQKQQERERILEALAACNWNRAKAAQLIGMPRRTFYRRLKKYQIQ